MKILVTGNSGSGKSTLGRKLSTEHGIPLYGLDKVVWKEGWTPTPEEERKKLIQEITNKDSWIIEGISKFALQEADIVYFLNLPLHKCLLNITKRFLKNGFKTREDLPNNCPEYIGVLKAYKIAFIFEKKTKPWIIEGLKNKKYFEFKKSHTVFNHIND